MAGELEISADASSVLKLLDQLGQEAQKYVLEACRITAEAIRDEAERRVARATGQTAANITVQLNAAGDGYVVLSSEPEGRDPFLPRLLEHGTKYMTARPFFDVAVDLERALHLRRLEDALDAAVDAAGLGL